MDTKKWEEFDDIGESTSSSFLGGTGVIGLLTIVFITLKLLDKIDWSWWWVLSPIWMSAGIAITILVVSLLPMILSAICGRD